MGYVIGTDEAGYGPNLGPLVISATVWEVAGSPQRVNLDRRLAAVIARTAGDQAARSPSRLVIADSKLLYRPPDGLDLLERGVLAMLGLAGSRPHDWRTLWELLEPGIPARHDSLPWHAGFNLPLPVAADQADLQQLAPVLAAGFRRARVSLKAVRSRTVFPEEFNTLTEALGNKASALSHLTLELVEELLAGLPQAAVLVVSDKHGGRSHYGPLLQQLFPEVLVEVRGESQAASRYCWGPDECRVDWRFCVGAEAFLPVALASMVSKYLRELAMRAFNHFWCSQVPELRPTAGYPHDSHRFKAEIREAQATLGIDDRILWRAR